jgi:alkylation response protein AidB-like acyl-CoA dehydrogenase
MSIDQLSVRSLPVVTENRATQRLRAEVREHLACELAAGGFVPRVDSWMTGWDAAFSRRLAEAGYVGTTIPREYGGQGRTFLERFVVTEELLAAGAPVAAHWFADRQVAPALLSSGTDEQRRELLPQISAGQLSFAIGMSEPDSGSDLASVRTRATRCADGSWRLNGTKVWTSGAHRADRMLLLARTAPQDPAHRHAGLSQFIVDLRIPGLQVRPILSMSGDHHFNEVVMEDVHAPPEALLGTEGAGWTQVNAELAFERSGPERLLSTQLLLEGLLHELRRNGAAPPPELGRLHARVVALHRMSMSVAAAIDAGGDVSVAACFVKMLGTAHEGEIVERTSELLDGRCPAELDALLRQAFLGRAGYTLRGGTNEILKGIAAREAGLR